MEELLNNLIERGWKPYGIEKEDIETISYDKKRKKISIGYMNWETPSKGDYDWLFLDLRQLTAKESGLWQFCCESKLIEQGKTVHDFVMKHICYADENRCGGFSMCNAEYYIMMCSLLEESELEQFLLDNIKIEGNLK